MHAFKIKLELMHPLSAVCAGVLLLVLWLLIGTRVRLLAVEPPSTTGPLCFTQYLDRTILMTLCLTVKSRANSLLLTSLLSLSLSSSSTILSFSSFCILIVCSFRSSNCISDRISSLSPNLAQLTLFNYNNI